MSARRARMTRAELDQLGRDWERARQLTALALAPAQPEPVELPVVDLTGVQIPETVGWLEDE